MILDKTAFVYKFTTSGNRDIEGFVTFSGFNFQGVPASAVKVNIQAASPALTAISEGIFAKTFKIFTLNSGIVEGMKLTVSGSNDSYYIVGREIFPLPGLKHYELTANKHDR